MTGRRPRSPVSSLGSSLGSTLGGRRGGPLAAAVAQRVATRVVDAGVRRVDVRRERVRVDVVVRYGARIDDVLHLCRVSAVHALADLGVSTPVEVRAVDVEQSPAVVVTEG